MMHARLFSTDQSVGSTSSWMMGYNLDWVGNVPESLQSQRLSNPMFLGPAHASTGIAPGWNKYLEFVAGVRYELEPGTNMAGYAAQRIHVFDHASSSHPGLVQPHRWVRRGQKLRVELWARSQGQPVSIQLGFRDNAWGGHVFTQAELAIDRTHFDRYEAVLESDRDHADCLFFLFLQGNGILILDRVTVTPVDEPVWRIDVVDAMRSLQIGALRWPAGCTACGYHWRRGVGPVQLRYDASDPTFHMPVSYLTGTDEYLELCATLNATPQIVINIGTGTPAEARDWAEYCHQWYRSRNLNPPRMLWQIGNEQWGAHEIGNMPAELYPQVLRRFVPGIRKAYPNSVIVTTSAEAYLNHGPTDLPWARAILEHAGDLVDMLAVHFYPTHTDDDPVRDGLSFVGDAHRYAQVLDAYDALIARSRFPDIKLAITEWGAFRRETHFDGEFRCPISTWNAMWITAMLNEFCRRSHRIALVNGYSLINFMPAIIARGPSVQTTATFDVWKFWHLCTNSTILHSSIDCPTFVPPITCAHDDPRIAAPLRRPVEPTLEVPVIDHLVGCNAQGPWVLLSNRSAEHTVAVQLPETLKRPVQSRLLAPAADGLHYIESDLPTSNAQVVHVPAGSHVKLQCE